MEKEMRELYIEGLEIFKGWCYLIPPG